MNVSLDALDDFVNDFVRTLPEKGGEGARVYALNGDLGAGKTTFVQRVAYTLGVTEKVTSPTFVIAQTYDTAHPVFSTLVHIDAYRLEDEAKDTIGFSKIVKNPYNLVFVEWPEHLPGGLPKNTSTIQFVTVDETTRNIAYA